MSTPFENGIFALMFDRILILLKGGDPGPMTEGEWMSLLWEAHNQRVMGLVADAVAALPEDAKPPVGIRMKLALELDTIEKRNVQVNSAAAELTRRFSEEGLHPLIQKGPSVAALYDNPLHRECGDIDLFFPGDEFRRSRAVVERLAADSAGASVSVPCDESDGAFYYKFNGVTVEHHPRYYDSAYQFPELETGSPESVLAMLSAHILKHALGRGIGLKQICDYFVARGRLTFDRALFDSVMRKAGLSRWQQLLDSFGPDLRTIVARDGNFGRRTVAIPSGKQALNPAGRITKGGTAMAFAKKLPFALKYAPKEWLHTVLSLIFSR